MRRSYPAGGRATKQVLPPESLHLSAPAAATTSVALEPDTASSSSSNLQYDGAQMELQKPPVVVLLPEIAAPSDAPVPSESPSMPTESGVVPEQRPVAGSVTAEPPMNSISLFRQLFPPPPFPPPPEPIATLSPTTSWMPRHNRLVTLQPIDEETPVPDQPPMTLDASSATTVELDLVQVSSYNTLRRRNSRARRLLEFQSPWWWQDPAAPGAYPWHPADMHSPAFIQWQWNPAFDAIQDAAALPQYNDASTQPVVTELEEELAEHAEAHDTILIEQLAEAHRKLYIFRMDRAMARFHAGIEDGSDDDGAFGD